MSLGLALYLLRSGRRHRAGDPVRLHDARPPGRLVWFHAADPAGGAAISELWPRIARGPAAPAGLMTGVEGGTSLPVDAPEAASAFLDHWKPSMGVLAAGALPAALITEAHRRDVPLYLIDTGTAPHVSGGAWYPGLLRALLQRMERVLAWDEDRAAIFRRLGAAPDRVLVTGRVEASPQALPCTEAEREALAQGLHTRLVWLAADVPPEEEESLLQAHAAVLRLSHRALMILVPREARRGPGIADRAEALGLSAALRSREDYPDDEDQVYVADTEGEYGLWYRLAQITFLGGTLIGDGPLRHPMEPAALGSAILHGPRRGAHSGVLSRLGAARAARLVGSVPVLSATIGELRAPDRTAMMAHNAWVVASSGADVTDRVAAMLLAALQPRGTA
ncbi:3-deoxy-D-manno-octulosonic acid transferase [Halodurantibacterium flavum]|uniref:3-deoxy-D-manno-octulosonic acid transferase n=1 Tax=Halodurantibacterium flavum TaxID=1382802 RepID=A0ABW4S734_9RHOB